MSAFAESHPPVLDDVSLIIEAEAALCPTPQAYVDNLEARYGSRTWISELQDLSQMVEPLDMAMGTDPETPAAASFYRGSILGLRVAETARGTAFLQQVSKVARLAKNRDFTYGAETPDQQTRYVWAAQAILNCGERGLRLRDPNVRLAATWEDAICPNITLQPFSRCGFGFVINASQLILKNEIIQAHKAEEARKIADLEVMRREIEAGPTRDWSMILKQYGL